MWNEYEDRIIWDDLAPSLQAIIRNTQTSIEKLNKLIPIVDNLVKLGDTTITNNLLKLGNSTVTNNLINFSDNSNIINNLINKSGDILNITNIFGGSGSGGVMNSWSGDPGKIAKTNAKGQLICDDLVYNIRAAANAADVSTLSGIPLSTKEIFDSWDRISHEAGVDNAAKSNQNLLTSGHVLARSAYYFHLNSDTICCNRNSNEWSAFLSNSLYDPNFKLRIAIDTSVQRTSDDDLICIIVGYMVDSKGVFHTLQVHRIGDSDTRQHGQRFCLCYDIYSAFYNSPSKGKSTNESSLSSNNKNADPFILGYVPYNQLTATDFNNRYCLVDVEKTTTTLKCYTSQNVPYANRASASLDYGFTWTLPSSKPAEWSQEMYDNIKQMMQNPSKIGFGTESNQAAFKILPDYCQNIMDIIEIYDLSTGTIKYYDTSTNTWLTAKQKPITNEIQPNSLVYSSYTKKLFYYRRDNNFVEMFTGGN